MELKAEREGKFLKILLRIQTPKLSRSGKSTVIATTKGPKPTSVKYKGKEVVIVANAFFYNKKKRESGECDQTSG
jgi:hypothetical protein